MPYTTPHDAARADAEMEAAQHRNDALRYDPPPPLVDRMAELHRLEAALRGPQSERHRRVLEDVVTRLRAEIGLLPVVVAG